ncbi:MAG TPA: glycosyltransferase family A protein [Thermodesulfovibrionales bacterium]|nr:glycosyltransferase family A protein [Thermodesulfovibrionales bacterium]
MREETPFVSVVIPVFNGEKYLREAVETVLGQTYQSFEIIVVDDGSTDSSAEVAKLFVPRVRYVFQSHGGISAALNYGISLSQGSFLAFLDADDLWEKDKLMHQMTVFDNNPDADIVFGHVRQFCSPELDENQKKRIRIPAEVSAGVVKGSMLIRRESFFRVGAFETKWKLGDFLDWYLKAAEKGLKSIVLDEVVMLRRIHANNSGIRNRKSQTDFVKILKASLDRRRRSAFGDGSGETAN